MVSRGGDGYFHCEWVWDRQQVWIVQADAVQLPPGDLPANRYIRGADLWPFKFVPHHAVTVESGFSLHAHARLPTDTGAHAEVDDEGAG